VSLLLYSLPSPRASTASEHPLRTNCSSPRPLSPFLSPPLRALFSLRFVPLSPHSAQRGHLAFLSSFAPRSAFYCLAAIPHSITSKAEKPYCNARHIRLHPYRASPCSSVPRRGEHASRSCPCQGVLKADVRMRAVLANCSAPEASPTMRATAALSGCRALRTRAVTVAPEEPSKEGGGLANDLGLPEVSATPYDPWGVTAWAAAP